MWFRLMLSKAFLPYTRKPPVRSLYGNPKHFLAYQVPNLESNLRLLDQLVTKPPGIHLVPITTSISGP